MSVTTTAPISAAATAKSLTKRTKLANRRIKYVMLTAEIIKSLPPLGGTDGDGWDAIVRVKFFGGGRWTWLITEAEPVIEDGEVVDMTLYGYCLSGLGSDCDEFGYVSLMELARMKFPPFALPVERDYYLDPAPLSTLDLS